MTPPERSEQDARITRDERRRTRAGLTVVITMLVVVLVLSILLTYWSRQQ